MSSGVGSKNGSEKSWPIPAWNTTTRSKEEKLMESS